MNKRLSDVHNAPMLRFLVVLTIVALVLTVQRVRSPSALTKPFERGG